MQWSLSEIRKRKSIDFDEELNLEESLKERYKEIIAVSPVTARGSISYEDGLYLLQYTADYVLSLPSTRSLEQVDLPNNLQVYETFATKEILEEQKGIAEEDNVLLLDKESIDLNESVADNIILEIPSRVLTAEEEVSDNLPKGNDWEILSEEAYEALQDKKDSEKKSPFASLDGLFD